MNAAELRKSAIQFLRGLQQAGLSDLPAVSQVVLNELTIEIDTGSEGSTSASSVSHSQSISASNETVAERPTEYQAKTVDPNEAKEPAASAQVAKRPTSQPASAGKGPTSSAAASALVGIKDAYGPAKSEAERASSLLQLGQQVAECTICPQLSACRKNTVFGVGSPKPRLAFFGEAPGADEDRLGEPFVGRSGDLLDKILAACQLKRDDVYLFNTVKCRPPNNRNPHDVEIQNCWNYSEKQLEILQPEFICCLGSVAAKTLLKTKDSVGRLRGKFHQYRGSRVVVTYHPAYLLRTPAAKAKTWQDMQMLIEAMGIDPEG